MDNDIMKAYLWNEVLRLGFSPSSDREKKSWVIQYGKSLKDFWEVGEYPTKIKTGSTVVCHLQANLEYEFANIINIEMNTTKLYYLSDPHELMWTHDVDSENYFLFPEKTLLVKYQKLQQAKKRFKNSAPNRRFEIIEAILNGLFCHPAVHQHIEYPIDKHEIRIGGGIYNPFVFLFHLRFQLCPSDEKRNEEKARLAKLFEEAIKHDKNISPNELFKQISTQN